MLCSSLLATGKGNVIPGSGRIPGSRHTAASATKESSSHKVCVVWKTPVFSALNIAKETLFVDLTLCKWRLWREWFSHSGHCLTPACVCVCVCVLSVRYWLIFTGWLHERLINWQVWQDIELGQVFVFAPWQNLFNSLFILACKIPGSGRIPGSRHTAASATKESSSHKVCVVWKTPAFSAFNVAKETLFIDLSLSESGNCEENGCLTMVPC